VRPRFTLAQVKTRLTGIACAALLLAACAPDAYIPSKPYDAFLARLAEACRDQTIGVSTVDQLVRRSQSTVGNYFMDQTSRLYFGTITTQDWTAGVTGALRGWPQDPGIGCVLREYNAVRQWVTPQQDAPPAR